MPCKKGKGLGPAAGLGGGGGGQQRPMEGGGGGMCVSQLFQERQWPCGLLVWHRL